MTDLTCISCAKEPSACWCNCPLCGKSSTAKPRTPEACGCCYEDLAAALRIVIAYEDKLHLAACTAVNAWAEDDKCKEAMHELSKVADESPAFGVGWRPSGNSQRG
jgi:hypothetical protein